MPFPISQLIKDRPALITIAPDATVTDALELMLLHDYSQLPLMGEDKRVVGEDQGRGKNERRYGSIVSSDSILRGLHFTNTTTQALRIIDIKISAPICKPHEDVFEVIDLMKGHYACLVVDEDDCLESIITDYDTSEYFRRRAENIMYVEDIENTIKDFITFAFPPMPDGSDNPEFLTAVQKAVAPPRDINQFKKAIAVYLNAMKDEVAGVALDNFRLNPDYAEVAFAVLTEFSPESKSFDDLTMAEYISMLLSESRWSKYKIAIALDKKALSQMLNSVRRVRNKVAHFAEVTQAEQELLQYCLRWLKNYSNAVRQAFQSSDEETVPHEEPIEIEPIVEIPNDVPEKAKSRYAPLAQYLNQQFADGLTMSMLTFSQVEELIGGELPAFARQHRGWWANDSVSRVQSKQWLGVGWRVALVDMEKEWVMFKKKPESNLFDDPSL